jgi:hypothetical protein
MMAAAHEGQSRIVASITSWRNWAAFSHVTPFPFPRAAIRTGKNDGTNGQSGHCPGYLVIVSSYPRLSGVTIRGDGGCEGSDCDGRILRKAPRPWPPIACSAHSKITKSASRQDFHDHEDFYIGKRSKSFAIMKDSQQGEAIGVSGTDVTLYAMPGRRLFMTAAAQ